MSQKLLSFVKKSWHKIIFIAMGVGSLTWFLVRVIPKPSRAAYPCMKASFPIASTFLLYLLSIASVTFFAKKAKEKFVRNKYTYFILFSSLGLSACIWALINNSSNAVALQPPQVGNQPIGEGKGIYPGRVVWVFDRDATDSLCTNLENDYWYLAKNNDLAVISDMFSKGIQSLTGAISDITAWDSVFFYYNNTHGFGKIGYSAGEKIVIKINLNGDYNSNDSQNVNTSPQICYIILNQLVNVVGVSQSDISIGDPNVNMNDVTYNTCHSAFPNVRYWGYDAANGRTPIIESASEVFFGSNDEYKDFLPQDYLDAKYMINIPVFKKHHRAGISLAAKNHFGSIASVGDAVHLHPYLPCPGATGADTNGSYGVYRCFVDIMGHKDLGGKTILYLVDGIWGSTNWGHPPIKWRMVPFNNDWPSSFFLSQDPVAIESVCFDFLYYEFDENHPTEGVFVGEMQGPYPHYAGTDDYLHQAADTANWPDDITYDPENDGSPLTSMGVHEHWNNSFYKKYSRNLGENKGIELVYIGEFVKDTITDDTLVENIVSKNADKTIWSKCYPNPFTASTNIAYFIADNVTVRLIIYNAKGQVIKDIQDRLNQSETNFFIWNGTDNNGICVKDGNYYYKIISKGKTLDLISGKMTKLTK